jgi:general secretion pathway protein K
LIMTARDSSIQSQSARRLVRQGAQRGGGNPGEAGSVILLVLMTLLLTAFALTKYLERTTIDLLADARDASAARLRVEAYSALETVLAVLQEFRTVDGALRSPTEGWGAPLEFAGYTPPEGLAVTVSLEDESGKLSLPHTDFTTLRDLFVLLGQKETDAERLADALLVWMRPGYEPVDSFSARATDYERDAVPFDPPGRALHSFAELASIKFARDLFFDDRGHPSELWRRFIDSVSLYDFDPPNINGARDTTLAALGGYDETNVRKIADYLGGAGSFGSQGPTFFRTQQDVAALVGQGMASPRLATQVSCLRINITVREGSTSFNLSAVVAPPGGARLPPADPPTASATASANNPPPAATPPANPTGGPVASTSATPPTAGGASLPALNYPFTLLEIRENDEITAGQPSSRSLPE